MAALRRWLKRFDVEVGFMGLRLYGLGVSLDLEPDPDDVPYVWEFVICVGPFFLLVQFR